MDNASASTIENFLQRLVCGPATPEAKHFLETVRTDGWRSYVEAIKDRNLSHYKVALKDPKAAGKLMPWVHRVISNANAVIRGSHRDVSDMHVQSNKWTLDGCDLYGCEFYSLDGEYETEDEAIAAAADRTREHPSDRLYVIAPEGRRINVF